MLHPSASSPPSAKSKHWMRSTPTIVTKAAYGPRSAARSIPPHRCPDEPVPGIVKLIICVANTNAPMMPMTGIFLASSSNLTLCIEYPVAILEQAYIVVATAGDTKASAICIYQILLVNYILNYQPIL